MSIFQRMIAVEANFVLAPIKWFHVGLEACITPESSSAVSMRAQRAQQLPCPTPDQLPFVCTWPFLYLYHFHPSESVRISQPQKVLTTC